MPKRKYEQKKRAAHVEETRRRIVEATVELHRTVGPASTQVAEVARRAHVQRVTVYNHFPDESSLLAACSAHWRRLHPAPNVDEWRTVGDPARRLRVGLEELYSWYRQTEPMTANVLRDAAAVPALGPILDRGLLRYLATAREVLTEPIRVRGSRRERVEAAASAALDFHLWRALSGLGDAGAAELGARLVEAAAEK